ncbi:MAG: AMP-binding protein, partial [Candidatus Acidiferrales bacterium]
APLLFESFAETLAPHARTPYPLPAVHRGDTAQIVFTSGTTADPKGVVITHGNLLANLEPLEAEIKKYVKYERLVHPLRFLNLLPLSHVFGQFLGLLVPPLLGATVIFQESLNPAEIIRRVKKERVSVLVAVPRLLDALKEKLERDFEASGRLAWFREQLASAAGEHFLRRWWRFRQVHRRLGWKFWALISGGATLDPETETFWSRLGFAVIQGYGLTETTSLVSVSHPFRLSKGTIGKVLPGREVKLADDGEILVRGESIAAGYWQGSASLTTKGRELRPVQGEEGWLHTGDLGALDADGNLYFKGRQKNVIVTPEGMNIYPEDLEAALRRQPEVRDCVVMGLARNGNAEPCAVLLLRESEKDDGEGVVQRANATLADFQRIRTHFVWPESDFPRTSTHKPQINVIQQAVEQRLRESASARPPDGSLTELVARVTGRVAANFSPTAKLETDLNLNSLDRVELLSALEDRFQVDLDETRFSAATTVGELEAMLRQPPVRPSEYHYPRWALHGLVNGLRAVIYYLLVWPATLLLGYPRVRERENLRGLKGPVLVVSNHTSIVDVGMILAALPARFRNRLAVSVQAEELEAMRRGGWLDRLGYWLAVALFNVFPLPRQSGFRESFQFAGECADRGYSVLVFPEGEFTRDGQITPFRAGIGLLAKNLGLPVVPTRIEGLFELRQADKRVARPGAITVTLGTPVEFPPETEAGTIAHQLEARVKALGRKKKS